MTFVNKISGLHLILPNLVLKFKRPIQLYWLLGEIMEIYKRNLPYVLFIALGLKLLVLGAQSLFDVLALLVLGLGLAFFELRIENSKFTKLSNDIKDLQENDELKSKILGEFKKQIESIRTIQGVRTVNGRQP